MFRKVLYIAFLAAFLCVTSATATPNTTPQEGQTWVINLKDVDIKVFVQQVADTTGKTFILDDGVTGNVTVVSSKPLNKDEVYDLFLTTLKTRGYTLLPTSEGYVVTKRETAKEGSLSVGKSQTNSGEELITKVIPLKHASAQELVQVLRPVVASYGHLAASDFSNSLLVVDHASNIIKIEKLIAQLDKPENSEMEVVKLKEAWVGNIAAVLKELAYGQSSQKQGKSFQSLRMVANEYDNSIILKGDKKERELIKEIIAKLDTSSGAEGNFQVIYLSYADAVNVAEILKILIATAKAPAAAAAGADAPISFIAGANEQVSIQPDKTLNALVVRADPETINSIRGIVRKLDIKRPQVLIEAAIVEVSGELSDKLGVQFGIGKDAATNLQFATTSLDNAGIAFGDVLGDISSPAAATVGGGLTAVIGKDDKFSVLIQALAANANANLLSTPSITTLDNQEAQILVGQNVPFITGSFTNDSGTTNPFTTIERQDIGISLKVTPHIHEGNSVRMDVQQEVSSLVGTTQAKASDLITNKRSIKTSILAENKEIIVIGGLIQDDVTQAESKIPLLGDIPLIGYLFRSQGSVSIKRNLFVFLHPTILHQKEDVAGVTQNKFDRIYDLNLDEKSNEYNKEKWCRNFNEIFGNGEVMPKGCMPQAAPAAAVEPSPEVVQSPLPPLPGAEIENTTLPEPTNAQ